MTGGGEGQVVRFRMPPPSLDTSTAAFSRLALTELFTRALEHTTQLSTPPPLLRSLYQCATLHWPGCPRVPAPHARPAGPNGALLRHWGDCQHLRRAMHCTGVPFGALGFRWGGMAFMQKNTVIRDEILFGAHAAWRPACTCCVAPSDCMR